MARYPFLPKHAGVSDYAIGGEPIGVRRPHLAQMIGDCIAVWPHVEHHMALALGGLLNTGSPAALGVFTALRGFRSQRDVIEGAAKVVLSPDELDLIAACNSALWTAQSARDDIGHGIWGVIGSLPDSLLWVSGSHYSPWNSAAVADLSIGHDQLLEKCFVYRKEDLQEALDLLLTARTISFNMALFCLWRQGRPESRDILRDRLLSQPLVRQALDHLVAKRSK